MPSAYGYTPSLPLAVVGSIVFSAISVYHVFLFVRKGTWFFWLMPLATLMEATGFCLRAYSSTHETESRKFLISYILLVLSPSLALATLFTTQSRLTWYTTPPHERTFSKTWLPDGLVKTLFKMSFLVILVLQFIGAGGIVGSYSSPTSTSPSSPDSLIASERMLRIVFAFQAISAGILAIIVAHFLFVSRKWKITTSSSSSQDSTVPTTAILSTGETPSTPITHLNLTLLLTSTLFTLRSTYRAFEFSSATPLIKEYTHTHEYTFWIFDALPTLAVFVLFAVYAHPGSCLPKGYTTFWFNKRKIRKLEAKVLATQTWPANDWVRHAEGTSKISAEGDKAKRGIDFDVEAQRGRSKQQPSVTVTEKKPADQGVGLGIGAQRGFVPPPTTATAAANDDQHDPCSVKYQSPAWPASVHLAQAR